MTLIKKDKKIMMKRLVMGVVLTSFLYITTVGQDTTDISKMLDEELKSADKNRTEYTTATFKTTRLIDGHSVENTAKGVLDVKISHRFGKINQGIGNFFGLDDARMRLGFDYGLTNYLMIGIGRSTYQKTVDGFFKLKVLRQSRGKIQMPVTVNFVTTMGIITKDPDSIEYKYFTSRVNYTHQLLIGRKVSDGLSLQLMPTLVHRNLPPDHGNNDVFALGIGGRQKLSKRTSFNIEYYYQLQGSKVPGSTNLFSMGFDIETGGHVFQLHLTNSRAMTESSFITGNTDSWSDGGIYFGFNISRVFNVGHKH